MERKRRNSKPAVLCAVIGFVVTTAGCLTKNDICMAAGVALVVCSIYINDYVLRPDE